MYYPGENVIPASPVVNSLAEIAQRSGLLVFKTITLAANAGSESLGCFTLTGSVVLKQLFGVIASTATFTNCTAAFFELYDATASVNLTANTGDLGGMAVGTVFAKTGLAAAAFSINNNATGVVMEPAAAGPLWSECLLTDKTGAVSTVRFSYTTTDAPIAATMTIYAVYAPVGPAATNNLVAV